MATNIFDLQNLRKQISGLEKEENVYQKKLTSSSTALGGEGKPTNFDISNQTSLQNIQNQIQSLKNQEIDTRWYGTDKSKNLVDEPQSTGFFGKALDFAMRPLYGIVGATKHVAGQGSGTLWEDIADNMARNKNTFGDVLKTSGVPWGVAAPLGFALDIAFDPVNWVTMGAGALVPRIGIGAFKGLKTGSGVARGIATAAKSGVLEKATTVGKFTPFFKKTEAFEKLGKASLKSTDEWEKLSGMDAFSMVKDNKGLISSGVHMMGLDTLFNKAIEVTPGAKDFLQHFIYDPIDWIRQARYVDIVRRSLGSKIDNVDEAVRAAARDESTAPFMKKIEAQIETKKKEMEIRPKEAILSVDTDASKNLPSDNEISATMVDLERKGLDREKIAKNSKIVTDDFADAADISNDVDDVFVSGDATENARRLAIQGALDKANKQIGGNISLEELSKIMDSMSMNQATGVKWFDDFTKKIRDFTIQVDKNSDKVIKVGKKGWDWYDRGMAIFRIAKVAASPSAWMNAVVGNLVMTHMAGGSIGPGFLKRLKQSARLYYLDDSNIASLFDDYLGRAGGLAKGGDLVRMDMFEFPTAYRTTIGGYAYVGDPLSGTPGMAKYAAKKLSILAKEGGVITRSLDVKEMSSVLADVAMKKQQIKTEALKLEMKTVKLEEKEAGLIAESKATKSAFGATRDSIRKQEEAYIKLHPDDPDLVNFKYSGGAAGTGLFSQEVLEHRVNRQMLDWIANKTKENPNNLSWRALNFVFNKAPEGYEKVDQSFKMATILMATHDGYTMNELRRISQLVDINPEELIKYANTKGDSYAELLHKTESDHVFTNQFLYRLPPKTALELANVMYLNYAAMPGAVKVLRNMPIFGSPFVSFMYGMALKTGQTIVHNPAAFNKVNLAMNEFGGTKTPLEKKALETSFYSYLKQPGMYRIPFFDKNPNYINMSSMIPYYSLNMFNPTQTTYGNSARENLVKIFQASPILKDPVGSVMFDYFITPLILGEAIRPQGQFGQPIYPIDANLLEKMGYATRTFGEAFVPNIAAHAGLVTGPIAPGLTDYIPSYRWRQLAMATQGKSQLGKSGKEDPVKRSVRTLANLWGVPWQASVNTNFINK